MPFALGRNFHASTGTVTDSDLCILHETRAWHAWNEYFHLTETITLGPFHCMISHYWQCIFILKLHLAWAPLFRPKGSRLDAFVDKNVLKTIYVIMRTFNSPPLGMKFSHTDLYTARNTLLVLPGYCDAIKLMPFALGRNFHASRGTVTPVHHHTCNKQH